MSEQVTYYGPPGHHIFYANNDGGTETIRFDDNGVFVAKREDHKFWVEHFAALGQPLSTTKPKEGK